MATGVLSSEYVVVALDADQSATPSESAGLLRRSIRATGWLLYRLVGVVSLVVALSVTATIPFAQFIVLGYGLEIGARIARSGRLRGSLPGLPGFAHVGFAAIATLLWWLPVLLAQDLARSAQWIAPNTSSASGRERFAAIFTVLVASHLVVAWLRGARIRHFLQPWASASWAIRAILGPRRLFEIVRTALIRFEQLDLWRYFWFGLRGFVGSLIWLLPPSLLLAWGRGRPLVLIIGGAAMIWVVAVLPFLQMRFAVENRFRAFFDVRAIRSLFHRTPLSFTLVVLLIVALATPLYLLKIEPLPFGFDWVAAVFFVAAMLPLKLAAGWVYGRAVRSERSSWRVWRWSNRVLLVPIGVTYAFFVFLVPYVGWNGTAQLLEHHAFLLPSPLGPLK